MKTLIQAIAATLSASRSCVEHKMFGANMGHLQTLRELAQKLPHGLGFDCGTTINQDLSTDDSIVFDTEFHHMNDTGYYDGWTTHQVTVEPRFSGINIAIKGQDKNGILDYIAEVFQDYLMQEVTL
jgi:hypothetical protein